jgi:hypothetical protein
MTPLVQAPPDRLRYLLELQRRAARIKHGITRYYDDPVGFARDCIDWGDSEGLTEYQEEILDGIPRRKRVAVRGPHGLGKALELSVRIPTPSGWSTIGGLRVGDEVFDEHGKPCRVTGKSPVWHGDTYEVEFADKTVITAHGEHEWNAVDVYHRPKTPKPDRRPVPVSDWRDHWVSTRRVTTAYMAEHMLSPGGQLRWRIPAARPLELRAADLPVDPYILGYWLGDGSSRGAQITICASDWPSLQERLKDAGYHHGEPRPHKASPSTFSVGVSTQPVRRGGGQHDTLALRLRNLGVLGNKHIPVIYQRASAAQRMEVVRGLWDSDGYRQAGGSDEITLTCKPLADDVAELLRSLGLVVRVSESDSKIDGRVVGRRWRIAARFDFNPYRLARYDWEPRGRQSSRHTQRTITDIRRVADKPTQCIEVDSPSHLYLAGDSMIPTHNSGIAAIAVHWFALTRDAAGVDWKIPATAGSWHQLTQYLFPEIHKWAGRLRWDKVRDGRPFSRAHELQNLNLRLAHGSAFAGASANAALIEGAHADSLLFLFDEGKAIPAATFDACEGALGGTGEAFALILSTPGAPSGRFYDICARKPGYEDWHPVHVTLERAIAAGRISEEWAEQRARQWGTESAIYQNRVLGEFYASDEDSVIPLAWAEAAVARWHAWDEAGRPEPGRPRTVGVDVARTGQDRTVLALRNGPVITELRRSVKEDTMQTTGRVKGILDADDSVTAVVDVIGIGAGVVDRLREQHARVLAFNASRGSKAKDSTREFGFANRRSEAWWTMRQALDPSSDPDICFPDDEMLLGDLSAPQWKVTSSGRIAVETKEEIAKRLGRSTDDGDAVIQAFVPHLGESSPGTVRKWAGSVELDSMGVSEETKAHRRMREIAGKAAEGLEDAPWDLDGFSPQDGDDRPQGGRRGNVRTWQ